MDKEEKVCFFKDRLDWRAWLENNCQAEKSVWLIYYKKGTGQTSISYNEAVEEAICYGWIDGRVKRIDQARYK